MQQAKNINEISYVTNNFVVGPDHDFYVNFSNLRGEFREKVVYRALNINNDGHYEVDMEPTKNLVFLAGMRGSGKTSELMAIAKNLHRPEAFHVVTCNLDDTKEGLNINNIEYVDVLFFLLERLVKQLAELDLTVDSDVLSRFQKLWSERIETIEEEEGSELNVAAGVEVSTGSWNPFLNIFGKLRASTHSSESRVETVRREIKNNFSKLASGVNIFLGEVARAMREAGVAQDILFIIDGMEKVLSPQDRRKVLIDEASFMTAIEANCLYTLPIELHCEQVALERYPSKVVSFPFVKLINRDGSEVEEAFERFHLFVEQRIDPSLFESKEVIREAISVSGGSPRQLLRIIKEASWRVDEGELITMQNMNDCIRSEANSAAKYLTDDEYKILYDLHIGNRDSDNFRPNYEEGFQELFEKEAIMEYNDGYHKRVNPLIVRSENFQLFHPDWRDER